MPPGGQTWCIYPVKVFPRTVQHEKSRGLGSSVELVRFTKTRPWGHTNDRTPLKQITSFLKGASLDWYGPQCQVFDWGMLRQSPEPSSEALFEGQTLLLQTQQKVQGQNK